MEFQLIDQNNLTSNHIAGFFDHQYLERKPINVFHGDSHQRSEIMKVMPLISYGQAWPITSKLA